MRQCVRLITLILMFVVESSPSYCFSLWSKSWASLLSQSKWIAAWESHGEKSSNIYFWDILRFHFTKGNIFSYLKPSTGWPYLESPWMLCWPVCSISTRILHNQINQEVIYVNTPPSPLQHWCCQVKFEPLKVWCNAKLANCRIKSYPLPFEH